uniref:Soluble scavenger receptor cysteine-rich domain-containing protein SSC5D n=1 Tax=Sphaeramia orbicularis TaxID=375764 RepID=A0A673B6Z1_9TELE
DVLLFTGIVKLAGGPNRCVGRVELYDKGQWGAVCGDSWDMFDAAVVCQELNCGIAHNITTTPKYGHGTGPVWTDQIDCRGQESILSVCPRSSFSNNTCNINSVAGVTCTGDPTLRLVNGTDRCSGRVEVLYNALNFNWGINEATVVCREMNCGDAVQFSGSSSQVEELRGYKVSCTGTESSLTQCTLTEYQPPMSTSSLSWCEQADLGVNRTRFYSDLLAGGGAAAVDRSLDILKRGTEGDFTGGNCTLFTLSDVLLFTGTLKLSGGPNRCVGRVELFENGRWGTTCGDSLNMNNAAVVCRHLNCGMLHKITTTPLYGTGTGQVWTEDYVCNGWEFTMSQCAVRPSRARTCNMNSIAGVICTGKRTIIRLVNGNDQCSGRVEVRYGEVWGTVCDTDWTMNKAQVVCELLDCGHAVSVPGGAHFHQGTGPVMEATDSYFKCFHSFNLMSFPFSYTAQIRLVNGASECSGRVEIFHKGQWGTVCDDDWGTPDAMVVCRQLGCGHAIYAHSSSRFGRGSGPIWLDDVMCGGEELFLTHCHHNGFGKNNCGHDEDAGVTCVECDKVRLVGPSRCSGRVEVFHRDSWGTVCDDHWSIKNAEVVCREANCGTAHEAKSGAFFGQGKDEIWLDDVQCAGHESSIFKCEHKPPGDNNCGHGEDAGVVCSEHVRVMNGSSKCSGRVEVYHDGRWKRVCNSDWGTAEADVVCREISCGPPLPQTEIIPFGEAHGLSGVKTNCFGNESSLSECSLQEFPSNCSKPIRFVNGTNRCSGRVELYHAGQWGTVCDDRWGMEEATVACQEMNCGNALTVKFRAFFGMGKDQVWMDDVDCVGNEASLSECRHRGFGEHDCDHNEDAGVICSGNMSCSFPSFFRLSYILIRLTSVLKVSVLSRGVQQCSPVRLNSDLNDHYIHCNNQNFTKCIFLISSQNISSHLK